MAIPLRNARNHSDATLYVGVTEATEINVNIQLKRDYTTIKYWKHLWQSQSDSHQ